MQETEKEYKCNSGTVSVYKEANLKEEVSYALMVFDYGEWSGACLEFLTKEELTNIRNLIDEVLK
ncbi:hypothetical protein ACU3L3_07095 [Priestia endophytica]